MTIRNSFALLTAVALATQPLQSARAQGDFSIKLSDTQRVHHALDRLTYGARPGDAERLRAMGLAKWLDEQLNPERIAENPDLEARLKPLASLAMSTEQMLRAYPPPLALRLVANGKMDLPDDPILRAGVERMVERYKVQKADGKQAAEAMDAKRPQADPEETRAKLAAILSPAELRTLRAGTQEEKSKLLAALPVEKVDQLLIAMPQQLRRGLAAIATPEIRRKVVILENPQQVIAYDLNEAKLQRAIYSNRQLEEQLADFWYNHFNVYLDKGLDRHLVTSYERDAIRPHVLGKFRDLLTATAHHPAMLFYLDNWQSVGVPSATPAGGATLRDRLRARREMNANGKIAKTASRGINENYARELLELHTLGVDGGYTQKDVTEVARCLTGWTIRDGRRGGAFEFDARRHDDGEKIVMGARIAAGGGQSDGDKVLEIVAAHESTARFVSRKLAIRFVADDPPAELVNRMAETFRKTDGDIRAVVRAMALSPEFSSAGAYRSKVKTPLEMVASAARAVNAQVDSAALLARQLNELGQPLYRKTEPTGYSAKNSEWVNSGALVGRMNFALSLAQGKVIGVKPGIDPSASREQLEKALIPAGLSDSSRKTIDAALADKQATAQLVAGLLLGSPEFQRR